MRRTAPTSSSPSLLVSVVNQLMGQVGILLTPTQDGTYFFDGHV